MYHRASSSKYSHSLKTSKIQVANTKKPEVNEIEDLTLGRPLVDYVSAGSEPKLTDVAKCTVTRAKPKADISWIYDSPSKFPSLPSFQLMFPT